MEGGKKVAAIAVLAIVIVGALAFVLKKSGVAGGPTPPSWVMEQEIERIDMESGEVVVKQLKEWESLGQKDGLYQNPNTKKYTMVSPMQCTACNAKIPSPVAPASMGEEDPDARAKWEKTVKCPKCGKNPFGA